MVTGFENLTYKLNEVELEVIMPWILDAWRKKKVGQIIQQRAMVNGINKWLEEKKIISPRKKKGQDVFHKLTGVRFRAIMHYIRVSGQTGSVELIANSKGFFLSNDAKEIGNFIKSCRERANSFNQTADALEMRLAVKLQNQPQNG